MSLVGPVEVSDRDSLYAVYRSAQWIRVVIGGTLTVANFLRCRRDQRMACSHDDSAREVVVTACSDFRDEVGVDLGGRQGGLQRLLGDEAVNMVLHSDMAAMLAALLTTRLLVAALVLAAMPPLRGATPRWCGNLV